MVSFSQLALLLHDALDNLLLDGGLKIILDGFAQVAKRIATFPKPHVWALRQEGFGPAVFHSVVPDPSVHRHLTGLVFTLVSSADEHEPTAHTAVRWIPKDGFNERDCGEKSGIGQSGRDLKSGQGSHSKVYSVVVGASLRNYHLAYFRFFFSCNRPPSM